MRDALILVVLIISSGWAAVNLIEAHNTDNWKEKSVEVCIRFRGVPVVTNTSVSCEWPSKDTVYIMPNVEAH